MNYLNGIEYSAGGRPVASRGFSWESRRKNRERRRRIMARLRLGRRIERELAAEIRDAAALRTAYVDIIHRAWGPAKLKVAH